MNSQCSWMPESGYPSIPPSLPLPLPTGTWSGFRQSRVKWGKEGESEKHLFVCLCQEQSRHYFGFSLPRPSAIPNIIHLLSICQTCLHHHLNVRSTVQALHKHSFWHADVYFIPGRVRFVSKSSKEILIGQPVDTELDVGAAIIAGKEVKIDVYSGTSVLEPGTSSGTIKEIGKLLSPLAESELGIIKCIGSNARYIVFPWRKLAN